MDSLWQDLRYAARQLPRAPAFAPLVAIVSEQVANHAWPRENPLGKRISFTGARGPFLTVVGVARDALIASSVREQRPQVYAAQKQYRHESGAEARLGSGLLAAFGFLALVLASVGVYAVISFSVRQRSREIGLRVALGAREQQVVHLFVREGVRLTGLGIVIGVLLALGVVRLLSALFLGVAALDVLAIAGVLGLLSAAALFSCWIPARRAARVDPMLVLRLE